MLTSIESNKFVKAQIIPNNNIDGNVDIIPVAKPEIMFVVASST